jgi:hypothetical protein
MLTADAQVYAHVPDFCWLDEAEKCQTEWSLFSKDRLQDRDQQPPDTGVPAPCFK